MNLQREYEADAWKLSKDGENVGVVDHKRSDHLMSAERYVLTTLAPSGGMYDPGRQDKARVEVQITRRRLSENQAR